MTLGETNLVDDYDPFWLPYQGLLFDGGQFIRAVPFNQPNIPLILRQNLITVEAWFKMNPLNPQGTNTGWLFVQVAVGTEPASLKLRDEQPVGNPVYFGIGIRGEAAIAAVNDRKVEVPQNYDTMPNTWRFISVSFVMFPKRVKTQIDIYLDNNPKVSQDLEG
jgi:hypothetical protein